MQQIEGILFEPVGCLAELPAAGFNEVAWRIFQRKTKPGNKSGSRSYWHLLNLIERSKRTLDLSETRLFEECETQSVDEAALYEDVRPSVTELKAMGIRCIIASSMCAKAVARFLDKSGLNGFFDDVWNRDRAGGIKVVPLVKATIGGAFKPQRLMFLTDTVEGLRTAQETGVNAVLMMNDPDEARRLTMHNPAGGVVSLHELPDFIRVVAAQRQES